MGYRHPDALLAGLSSRQWTEWMAYYKVEPFGHATEYGLLASIVTILANVHRKKGARAVHPHDFYQVMEAKGEKQSTEEIKTILMGMVAASSDREAAREQRKARRQNRVRAHQPPPSTPRKGKKGKANG